MRQQQERSIGLSVGSPLLENKHVRPTVSLMQNIDRFVDVLEQPRLLTLSFLLNTKLDAQFPSEHQTQRSVSF
jgi:hypothetical protein